MATKIESLIIVNQLGTSQYHVGAAYNGLILSKIVDNSYESNDVYCSIYRGLAENGDLVFEAINAPVVVRFIKPE